MGGRPTPHSCPNKKSPADTGDDQQHSQRGGSFMSCRGANRLTPYGRLPAGRACSRRWTSPAVLHAGTPQASGSRRKGVLDKNKRQRPVQARQGHRKLIPGTKKTPSRCELQGGLRTIFGSGLLSHMTLCSIIGDGELNFRVRNGVGCTLSSMATKEIWQMY